MKVAKPRAVQHFPIPQVADRGAVLMGGWGVVRSGYNAENLTVDPSRQRVWRVPRSMHDKDLFNLIKIRSPHLFPIFYRLFTSRRMADLRHSFRGQYECIIN